MKPSTGTAVQWPLARPAKRTSCCRPCCTWHCTAQPGRLTNGMTCTGLTPGHPQPPCPSLPPCAYPSWPQLPYQPLQAPGSQTAHPSSCRSGLPRPKRASAAGLGAALCCRPGTAHTPAPAVHTAGAAASPAALAAPAAGGAGGGVAAPAAGAAAVGAAALRPWWVCGRLPVQRGDDQRAVGGEGPQVGERAEEVGLAPAAAQPAGDGQVAPAKGGERAKGQDKVRDQRCQENAGAIGLHAGGCNRGCRARSDAATGHSDQRNTTGIKYRIAVHRARYRT